MNINDYFVFWNHAHVTIQDVRLIRINESNCGYTYRLPANCYLYVLKGHALVRLDEQLYRMGSYYLLHGGKGMQLVFETTEPTEYIMILYRAQASPGGVRRVPRYQKPMQPPICPMRSHLSTLQSLDKHWSGCLKHGMARHKWRSCRQNHYSTTLSTIFIGKCSDSNF
jgi:hypothetical protein